MSIGQFDTSFQQNFGSNPQMNRGMINLMGSTNMGLPNFGPHQPGNFRQIGRPFRGAFGS